MRNSQKFVRHPLEHPVATLVTIALGAVGQLLFTRALAKAAEFAERDDLHPGLSYEGLRTSPPVLTT